MGPDAYLVAVSAPSGPPPPWLTVPSYLRLAYAGPSLKVWVTSRSPGLQITAVGPSAVLIGNIFESGSLADGVSAKLDLSKLGQSTVEQTCDRLLRDGWGRYVLVSHSPQLTAAFRDPSGALDCLTWRRDGVQFFANRLPRDYDALLPSSVSIDWSAVAHQLRDALAVSGASAVRNVTTIPAGGIWLAESGGLGHVRQLWRPSALVRAGREDVARPVELLRQRVRTCVATVAEPYQRPLVEISGGLDSAIVATALMQSDSTRISRRSTRWINFATSDLEGDERRYARAVAEQTGAQLTERVRPDLVYTLEGLAAVGTDLRVGLTALDPDYDAELAEQARDHRADALVTGQGGDAVFLQMACDEALADRLRLRGRLELSELLAHSRRWRTSIWRTLRVTLGRAVWPAPKRFATPAYLVDRTDTGAPPHPWLEDLRGLPAAKVVQIDALVASQNVFGSSRRGCAVSCLHPLLSQPVVELTLSLPSFLLTQGGADRALARAAFAAWLPPVLLDRRSKGSLQAFYGRAVAASLDVLRPWLLDGVLAREGLLRIDRLEPLLDPDVLIMKDVYVDILHAAAMEAWVRGWAERVSDIKMRPPDAASPDCHSGT